MPSSTPRRTPGASSTACCPRSPPRCALADHGAIAAAASPAQTGRTRLLQPDAHLLVVLAAALLPVAYSPVLFHSYWAPKAAVLVVVVGPGLVVLAHLARGGDRGALAASSFVALAGVATVLSDNPVLSLFGPANWGTGWLFVAALAGLWALGATLPPARRDQLVVALVAGAVVNAGVAWLQVRGLVPPSLESPGRSAGLMGNPVHLGALAAGALWLSGDRFGRRRGGPAWLGAVFLLAGAAQVSGGRSAAGLGALAVVASLRGAGWRRAAAIVAATLAGVVLAPAAVEGATLGSARSVGTASTQEVGLRFDLWRTGAGALGERPVLGWGPGRFQAATSPRYSVEVAGGGVVAWKDAHNWVVEHAVATGLLGLSALAVWLVLAGRRARGPLAGFAVVVGLFMLVEPQTVGLTPLALLALGAAGPGPPVRAMTGGGRRAMGVLGAVGAAVALVLLAGQYFLYDSLIDTSVRSHDRAAALLPNWPEVAIRGSRTEAFHGLGSLPHRRRSVALARDATRHDPADPSAWAYRGFMELTWGSEAAAARSFRSALARNPWLAEGWRGTALVAHRRGDAGALREACARLDTLGRRLPRECRAAHRRVVPPAVR